MWVWPTKCTTQLLLVLGQVVGDLIIVAFVGDKDVVAKLYTRWLIKCAHGNSDLVACDGVPEKEGTTLSAKAASYFLARCIPSQLVFARDRQSRFWHIGGGPIMPALFPALGAMAGIRLGKVALHSETDVATQARTLWHGRFSPLSRLSKITLDTRSLARRQVCWQRASMKRIAIVFLALIGVIGVISLIPGYAPVSHAFFASQEAGKVEVMAHGAGQGVAPTNTLLGLRTAAAQGADVLEVDVQLTKDSVLILHHDDTLDRTTDMTGPVSAKTWAQIAAQDTGGATQLDGKIFSGNDTKVARLDVALAAFPNARWNIEIKNDSPVAAAQLCMLIITAQAQERVLVASFHDKAMAHFREKCPRVATSMAPEEIRMFVIAAHARLSRFVPTPATAVQVPVAAGGFDLTDRRFVAALKARGIKLHYWTINEPAQMDTLIKAGADGLLTDYVTRGRKAANIRRPDLPVPVPSRP
jgi:glycerophosphoryl diester phosphodiesterase